MKYKVRDLEGALLDAAVAKADGIPIERRFGAIVTASWDELHLAEPLRYSSDWAHGGPIIERERIAVAELDAGVWCGVHPSSECARRWCSLGSQAGAGYMDFTSEDCDTKGPTPLVAAMRARVASKFGDEVELP